MLGNVQHHCAGNIHQAQNIFKFNHSLKLMLLESVPILFKKAEHFLCFLRLFYIFTSGIS